MCAFLCIMTRNVAFHEKIKHIFYIYTFFGSFLNDLDESSE